MYLYIRIYNNKKTLDLLQVLFIGTATFNHPKSHDPWTGEGGGCNKKLQVWIWTLSVIELGLGLFRYLTSLWGPNKRFLQETAPNWKQQDSIQFLSISKSILTNFYESPFHLDAKVDEVTLKKVVFPPEAIAFASKVLPVPGGPKSKTPFQALLIPVNKPGIKSGSKTAS